MTPVRTCLGCRKRADSSSLLRVVARDGKVVADPFARLTGRGAWVHSTPECVQTSITRKAFGRALRVEGVLDASEVLAATRNAATRNAAVRNNAVQLDAVPTTTNPVGTVDTVP